MGESEIIKFGDPFLVSDIGRISDCGLGHILEHCPTSDHFEHLFSVHDLEKSIAAAKDMYIAAEMKSLFSTLSENNVEYFLLRQLGDRR